MDGIEIRIWSVGQDNSQSWVRISYGTNKYVIDSNHNNTEILADPHEDPVPQTSVKVITARSKAKTKLPKRESVDTPSVSYRCTKENGLTLIHQYHLSMHTKSRRNWSVFFDTIKQYSGKTMEQLNSGEENFIFEIIIHKYIIGLTIDGKLVWLQEEDSNEDISIALIIRVFIYLRALQGHFWKQSHWSYSTGQRVDWNWNIPSHLPRRMHIQSSFYFQQWIHTGKSRFEQKTDSILLAYWTQKQRASRSWIYWPHCTTSSAIRAQRMEEAPRRGIFGLILTLRLKRD